MTKKFGPHLLGRKPSPPDERDWHLATFLAGGDDLDAALAALLSSRAASATKAWAKIVTARIQGRNPTPPPPPPPKPDSQAVSWPDPRTVLNQGQTPHCVGFGWCQWGNTLPVGDQFTNGDGDAVYYECKVIDGEPRTEDGSNVRSGAKAMVGRRRLGAYAFAGSTDDITAWVRAKGPLVVGTDWHQPMFDPDAQGFVAPNGTVAGGHCYLLVGHDPDREGRGPAYEFLNSWGQDWARGGRFWMTVADFGRLLAAQGEACAGVELPLA